jgi:hypothetical protein
VTEIDWRAVPGAPLVKKSVSKRKKLEWWTRRSFQVRWDMRKK